MKYLINCELSSLRADIKKGVTSKTSEELLEYIINQVYIKSAPRLINVINGTGIVLHTGFGRAPFYAHTLRWLFFFLMLRQSVSLYFHESTFYADEFKYYFTTLHGLVYDHMLGEWYERKVMRSYVMLFPLLPFVLLYKWLQIENIYILEIIIKGVIGIYTSICLILM